MAKYLKLTWMPDLKAENDLRMMRVAFEMQSIPFPRIDMLESSHNGARLGEQIVRNLVDDYKQGMRNGDAFPRLVGFGGKAGIILTSGVQRATSISELIAEGELPKDQAVEIYVMATADPMLADIFTRSANVAHGGRATHEERLHHAIWCVQKHGMAVPDAAKIFMVSDTGIRGKIRGEKVRRELEEDGIDASGLPTAHLRALADLDFDASLQSKIGSLIATVPTTLNKLEPVVKAMVKSRSEGERRRIAKDFEKELYEQAHANPPKRKHDNGQALKVPRRPRRDELLKHLTGFVHFLETGNSRDSFKTLQELQIASAEDTKKVRDLWERATFRMGLLLGKGKK